MPLSNILLKEALQALVVAKEPLLQGRLEGGISPIRNEEFITNDYKNEDLIEPSDGLYDVMKQIEDWTLKNMQAPGADKDEVKKKFWKKHSEEMSKQISKQLANWLRDDIMPELAIIINTQIKLADITITVPPTSVLVPVPPPALTVPTITGTPIPPTNVIIT